MSSGAGCIAETTQLSTDAVRWRSVSTRARGAAGRFFYAVKTTGVYCRPGCPARLPKRERVEYFDNGEGALAAGYRPCERCRPDGASQLGASGT